jgi:UDP-N-acetyl-2-amino-2-deoxyglucuronate dehydrogenase
LGTRGRAGTLGPLSSSPDQGGPASSDRPPTRLAIIGCGFIGTVHSFAIRSIVKGGLAEAAVVATCDTDIDRAKSMLEPHGPGIATDDVDEALSDVDAAWVCTPTSAHHDVVERCVANGVALYCEKPLAPNLAGAEAISQMVENSRLVNQVGLVLRSSPPIASIASLCRGESVVGGPDPASLGAPMAAVLRDDQCFPVGGMYRSEWRADVSVAGGGALLEHSIHDVDLLTWMLGPVVSVVARTANHAGHREVEDVAAVTFEHSSGALSTLLSVWHGVRSRPSTRRLEVFFERAHIVLEDEEVGPVKIEQDDSPVEFGLPAEALELLDRLDAPSQLKPHLLAYCSADLGFVRSVASGQVATPGIGVALEAHRVVDAAYRSAADGGAPRQPQRTPGG